MADDTGNREQEIFLAAVELPVSERSAYIFHACSGNAQMELRIHRLIAAHEYAQEASSHVTPPPYSQDDPETIGPYRLLERIGEGGMGVVYLAEQTEPVRRRVALKIIKLGMDTREVIARFETERQALAMMNHQNIARILDVGATEGGRPYFVMEYVPGIAITEYCNKMRLSLASRLALFRDVCLAVQHAHQKGIIHRDIKPSNVLVSVEHDTPVAKVIDFGVAKATDYRLSDLALHTRIGHFIGTPEYMSPEQAEMSPLNVDTRSDVYSLGAVLHELLVGVRPLEFEDELPGFVEIQKAIRSVEPPYLDTRLTTIEPGDVRTIAEARSVTAVALQRAVRGELSWITSRALAKDPARRYPTAQALANDVQRFLDDEAVEASPESVVYRGRKFVRRHRAALSAAAIVLVTLIAGLGTATFGLLEAQRERDIARQAQAEAETVTGFLAHMLSAADPKELGKDVTVVEMLDAAAAALPGEFTDSPLVEARLRGSIGETYRALGRFVEAENNLRRRAQLYVEHLPEKDPRRLNSEHELARLHHRNGRLREAEEIYRAVLAARREVLGVEHPQTLETMNNLALVHYLSGDFAAAEAAWRSLLEIDTRLFGDGHPNTLSSKNNMALMHEYHAENEEALKLLEEVLEARLALFPEDHPAVLLSRYNIGQAMLQLGDYAGAESWQRDVVAAHERVYGRSHHRTLRALAALGEILTKSGQHAEAEALLREVLNARRRLFKDGNPELLLSYAHLGRLLLVTGRVEDAEPLLAKAANDWSDGLDDNPTRAEYRGYYGRCLLRLNRPDDAEAILLDAYSALAPTVASGGAMFAQPLREVLTDLVELYDGLERHDESRRYRELLARDVAI